MPIRPTTAIIAGGLLCTILAFGFAAATGPALVADLQDKADRAIAKAGGRGIKADFTSFGGASSRHPVLSGGERSSEALRDKVAKAVGAIPGVGGVHWIDGSARAQAAKAGGTPLHCQDDVDALLRARTIRFEESSAAIDPASRELVDEVANALRPCLGAIIAITGHTDSSGTEPGNIALSQARADAIRLALINRGIPSDGLRARGVGSSEPVPGLDPADPANRRIEFSVIATVPLAPTPVDTPGPR
ncbi:MAG: OmpA family protein [Sphingomonadales bacterium]|nr:OmpA family protein [Sphingomonadales bacterium]MBD3775269.1 OmpA family protein [Paracoccaceae bacterium]